MKLASLTVATLVLGSCSIAEEVGLKAKNPIKEARALNELAEKCLLDVRDNNVKFEISEHCADLGRVSRLYIDAGGQKPDEPIESKYIAEQAVKMAWNAQAVSATGNPTISLW